MKIFLIYDYLSEIGGAERVIATHARWLEKAGHDVTLFFNYVSEEAKKYAFLQGLKIEESCSFKKGGETFKVFSGLLFNKFKNYNPDLIICYSFPSIFSSRKLKCKKAFYYLPMEFIYYPLKKRWEWANDSKRKMTFFASLILGPILKVLDKKWIKNKLVIANGEMMRKEVKRIYRINAFVSYPPLNDVFKPVKDYQDVLKKYNLKNKFVLTAGRIIPDKKTDWLIEVFSKLNEGNLDFIVAGGIAEDYKKILLEIAEKFNVQDKIKLIGLVDQKTLVKLYSACELFMFASPEEAFGLVPIEAMACGAPVIAWNDNAGPNEYVINNVNGYLAKPYDLNDFTEKVKKFLKSGFRGKNKGRIVNSVKKFSEEEQSKRFLDKIKDY